MPDRLSVCLLLLLFALSATGVPRSVQKAGGQEPIQLSNLKVVSLFQNYVVNHPIDESIRLLKETSTELVFRGFFRWNHQGPYLEVKLGQALRAIKRELPNIQFMGTLSLRGFVVGDTWPNGTSLSAEEVKGIVFTLPDGAIWIAPDTEEPVLDIAKPLARKFVVDWAKLQVDAGVNSIFFDEVEYAAMRKVEMGLLSSISQYYPFWKDIVDQVKSYALTNYGREVLVTINQGWINAMGDKPHMDVWPSQDFISISFSLKTIKTSEPQDDWQGLRFQISEVYGRQLPIIGFMDWGMNSDTPLGAFATLSVDQQVKVLKMLNEEALRSGILFAFPLAGGGESAGTEYDSVEDGTYDTIKTLSNSLLGKTVESSTGTRTSLTSTTPVLNSVFEIRQDNGYVRDSFSGLYKNGTPRQLAVMFTPPFEIRLTAARVMIPDWIAAAAQTALEHFRLRVLDSDLKDTIALVDVKPASFGWVTIDLSSYNITTGKAFAISVEFPPRVHYGEPALGVGLDNGKPLYNQSYYRTGSGEWISFSSLCARSHYCLRANAMIRAEVSAEITTTSVAAEVTAGYPSSSEISISFPATWVLASGIIVAVLATAILFLRFRNRSNINATATI